MTTFESLSVPPSETTGYSTVGGLVRSYSTGSTGSDSLLLGDTLYNDTSEYIQCLSEEFRNIYFLTTSKFDKWAAMKKKEMSDARGAHRKQVADGKEKMTSLEQQLAYYQEKEQENIENEKKEEREREEAKNQVQTLKEKLESKTIEAQELEEAIERLTHTLHQRRSALQQRRETRKIQMLKNEPEWKVYQEKLAWDIQPIRADVIKFVFTHIDETDWDREYSFIIDVSDNEYKVPECTPMVPHLHELVKVLCESRDLFQFLKCMRKAFVHS